MVRAVYCTIGKSKPDPKRGGSKKAAWRSRNTSAAPWVYGAEASSERADEEECRLESRSRWGRRAVRSVGAELHGGSERCRRVSTVVAAQGARRRAAAANKGGHDGHPGQRRLLRDEVRGRTGAQRWAKPAKASLSDDEGDFEDDGASEVESASDDDRFLVEPLEQGWWRRSGPTKRRMQRSSQLDRQHGRDAKAELNVAGLYRPCRRAFLLTPWEFRGAPPPTRLSRERRFAPRSSLLDRLLDFAAQRAKRRSVAAIAAATAASSSSSGTVVARSVVVAPAAGAPGEDADKDDASTTTAEEVPVPRDLEAFGPPPGLAEATGEPAPAPASPRPPPPPGAPTVWRRGEAPATADEEWTEEDTAEMSRLAAEEASRCIAADGSIVERRLRTLLLTAQPRLAKQVLGRLPAKPLHALARRSADGALGLRAAALADLLTGDVLNSALLAEHGRCRAAWLRRPPPGAGEAGGAPPPPLGRELTCIKVPMLGDEVIAKKRRDLDELRHPTVQPSCPDGSLVTVPSMGVFRALLSLFTHGISDRLPYGSGVVVGGSACFACVALPRKVLQRHGDLLRAAGDLASSAGTTRRALVAALGGAGGNAAATLILSFAAPWDQARRMLEHIEAELYGRGTEYAGSDIDLFFQGSSKEDGARALEATRRVVTEVMSAGGRSPPCTVRTPNSVSLCGHYPMRHTQLVCKLAEDTVEILAMADMHCTAMAYDGRRLWGTPLARRAFELGYSFMSNASITAPKAEVHTRVAKYARRGCGTMVYELCRHEPRCDVRVDDKVKEVLAKAKKIADTPKNLRWVPTGPAQIVMGVHGYDEVHLPRGRPEQVAAFVSDMRRQQAASGTEPTLEVVECRETVAWWAPLLEWRRDRVPQLRRKFGLDAELAARCHMCSKALPSTLAEGSSPKEGASPKEDEQRRVQLCVACAQRNADRVADREDLSGRIVVVTGGRCKIGYEVCLTLLRCGAFVVASTRFPRCAAMRFAKEPDAAEWLPRLHIYGADLSDFASLQGFATQLAANYDVDILVNNAAQTIRRPPAYYAPLFEQEREAYLSGFEGLLAACNPLRSIGEDPWAIASGPAPPAAMRIAGDTEAREILSISPVDAAVDPALRSAALSMLPRLPGDDGDAAALAAFFPEGGADAHGEQLDLRPATSWTSSLAPRASTSGIAPRELLEVLAVNAAAPFILLQALVPKLLRPNGPSGRFVVNVTSAEGVFGTWGAAAQGAEHPHSNMAKAALNMLTKTADAELSPQGVYCTAVDPGWVSMMRPGDPTAKSRPLPPLSEADGAARVLAPVLDGVRALARGAVPPHGVLLRHFDVASW